jgi:hypothetical protein
MARMRTDSGKTFNMRGLERQAGSANYEFAYMTEGVGANSAAKAKVPEGMQAQARRSGANQPSRSGQ